MVTYLHEKDDNSQSDEEDTIGALLENPIVDAQGGHVDR